MALKALFEKMDDVPDALRDHYAEDDDGKAVLQVDGVGGYALEDVGGLKTTLSKEMSARKAAEKALGRFKDLDPDDARAAIEKMAEFGDLDPEKEAEKIANAKLEAAKAQLLKKHGEEVAGRDERIGSLTKVIDDVIRRQAATEALARAEGSVDLLLPHVMSRTRLREEDGRFSVEVVDGDGNVQLSGKGTPLAIGDMVAEMKGSETYARAFKGSGQSGSGAPPGSGAGGGNGTGKGKFGGSKDEHLAAVKSMMAQSGNA